jgi:hypothetical protein
VDGPSRSGSKVAQYNNGTKGALGPPIELLSSIGKLAHYSGDETSSMYPTIKLLLVLLEIMSPPKGL